MPPISIMIKPASGLCNLRCEYCFYHDVTENRSVPYFGIMSNDTADKLIKKAMHFADGCGISFAFQGGEPLIAGIDYFRNFVKNIRKNNVKNSPIYLSIQTNGTLITDEWARLFKEYGFLVGLSLDGDFDGNKFRVDKNNESTFQKVISAAELLRKYDVDFNILTVLTGYCADNIERIYGFFKEKEFRYLQFIPCLRPFGDKSDSELYMTAEQYGNFLIKCFNLYLRDYINGQYTSVRYFDNLVNLYRGNSAEQCGMCGYCMHQFVAESNGNIYPCDFYCLDEWLLGNINDSDTDFNTMAHCERAIDFLKESLDMPKKCKSCNYYFLCRGGGCKRSRADRDYCEAYKKFFSKCLTQFKIF